MLEIFLSALKNFNRKKGRTFLTLLGIIIGIASVIIIGTIGDGGRMAVNKELDSLGLSGISITSNTNSEVKIPLTNDELETIKLIENVEDAMPIIMKYSNSALRGQKNNSLIWGIDSGAKQIISLELLYGRAINKSDVTTCNNVCLIDQKLSKSTYGRENIVGKSISVLINGTYEEFKIIGIVSSESSLLQNMIGEYIPSFIYLPYTTMQNSIGSEKFDQIAVKLKNSSKVDYLSKEIENTLDRQNGVTNVFKAENLMKQRDKLTSMLNIVTLVLSGIGSISLIVAGLGIMTIMLVSVNERTREIGIKKAIGAKNYIIMIEFLIEALIISLFGSIIGSIFAVSVTFFAGLFFNFNIAINFQFILQCILFTVIIGIIFGVYPAYKASRLKPVDALKTE